MKNTKVSEHSERLEKLKELRKNKINPYPAKSNRTFKVKDIFKKFKELEKSKKVFCATGRLMSKREHGNLIFSHIKDASGKIQIAFSKKEIGADKFKNFKKLIDIGDFLEVKGISFVTHKGEKSIMAGDFKLLSKALRPLPEKWHGLKDEEEKLRKRYLDIIFNDEIRAMIEKKAVFWNSVRQFMGNNGFLEVETPVMEVTVGGADARPFITHHNALDMDVYLRISMGELWQKRLMIAGLEKTFEIGRQFRNEGMSPEHMQDYTQMEFYWAYADYEDGMKLVEKLFKYIAEKTFATLKFNIRGYKIDMGKKWEVYDFQKLIKEHTGVDVLSASQAQIEKRLKELKIEYDKKGFNLTRAIDNLWKYCRKNIAGPGFLVNVPVTMEPLAKRSEKNPQIVERFQVMLAGSELGKGYSELNDPIDQAERFKTQQKLRDAGDEEAQMYDHDFIEALEYGMPPTCGFGMSERLFSFLMDKSMRECQIFPLMKPRNFLSPQGN